MHGRETGFFNVKSSADEAAVDEPELVPQENIGEAAVEEDEENEALSASSHSLSHETPLVPCSQPRPDEVDAMEEVDSMRVMPRTERYSTPSALTMNTELNCGIEMEPTSSERISEEAEEEILMSVA
jgi:hypothetical protein